MLIANQGRTSLMLQKAAVLTQQRNRTSCRVCRKMVLMLPFWRQGRKGR